MSSFADSATCLELDILDVVTTLFQAQTIKAFQPLVFGFAYGVGFGSACEDVRLQKFEKRVQ